MSRVKCVYLVITLGLAAVLIVPNIQKTSEDWGWQRSAVCLREISLALQNYADIHGRLPPPVTYGKNGEPLHSWRVLLLPYLEQDSLYRQIHLDEPWDSPHNIALLEKTPRCYCPARETCAPAGTTRFQAFVGPGTAFATDRFPANTTLIVVDAVPWAKPVDLTYDLNGPLPSLGTGRVKPVQVLGYNLTYSRGFTACFSDGTVHFIDVRISDEALRGLTKGEENVDRWALD